MVFSWNENCFIDNKLDSIDDEVNEKNAGFATYPVFSRVRAARGYEMPFPAAECLFTNIIVLRWFY